jgi:hypothetical protein
MRTDGRLKPITESKIPTGDNSIVSASDAAPDGSALGLLRLPFVFTQDQLLSTSKFLEEAARRGHRLGLEDLQEFHRYGLLVPLYRVSDCAVEGRRIPTTSPSGMNARGWVFDAAREGRLRDGASEGYSTWWPYQLPANETGSHWWNRFVFSSWQLLDLKNVINRYQIIRGARVIASPHDFANGCRARTLALAALSTRHLPGVLGQVSSSFGREDIAFLRARFDIDDSQLLTLAGFEARLLKPVAENLLSTARGNDPMSDWWPLLRHASLAGWSKFKGAPLDCVWQRIGAELLLRAHDELATDGLLEPLPSLDAVGWRVPLHDRLSLRDGSADSLERALGNFGLSPFPRALLLLEGKTEMVHIPRLLAWFGLDSPDLVRVHDCGSSKVNLKLIVRHAVSPRLGQIRSGIQFLDATPTALFVAMDPENDWATPELCEIQRAKLREAVREEVIGQGGNIQREDLDFLINVFVWGDQTYELANFSDEELIMALSQLAKEQSHSEVSSSTWTRRLRTELEQARADHADIKIAIGKMRIHPNKPRLAQILWPILLAKVENELEAEDERTPVLLLITKVRETVALLSSGSYALRNPVEPVSTVE